MTDIKRHKQHEIEHTDDMIDRISNLPDGILHHILSFLPTLEVVWTSILSKRWKNLWASVSSLNLDQTLWCVIDGGFPNSDSFINFEQRILRSRDASRIEKIDISCHGYFDPSRISSWICDSVMRNVRELDLCLFDNDPSAFSQSIFDSKSLITLRICLMFFVIPSRINIPCLKTLHLCWVIFPDEESTDKLFSNCLVLEELILVDCDCKHLNHITISSLTLKKLTIKNLTKCWSTDNYPVACKIKIDAKNLTYLEYDDAFLTNEIVLNNVPSLVKACIHIPVLHEREKEVASCVFDLLKGLRNVAYLSVSNSTLESLIHADMMNIFPLFSNLTHLVVTTEIKDYTFGTFIYLLNFCPILQSISLFEGFNSCILLGENDSICLPVPICILYHLKTLSFKNFHASDSEMWFLKFVLRHACVLEKMNVWWCKPELGDLNKQRDVRKEFEIAEKISKTCIINFA